MRWALPLLLVGCQTQWDEEVIDGLRVLTTTATPKKNKRIPLTFNVEDGEDSMLLTLNPASATLGYIWEVRAPGTRLAFNAEPLWTGTNTKTNAAFAATVTNLAWPISAGDVQLEPGTWKVDARVEDVDTTVDITLAFRQADADLEIDTLNVQILLLGSLSEDADVTRATLAAFEHWRDDIYGPAGIELVGDVIAYEGPESLPSANQGDPLYETIATEFPMRTITVVVVDRIEDGAGILGVSGGIPGALAVTPRSSVTVSALEASGRDGVFSLVDQQLFGETMAHEVSHYLGLFHPVELPTGNEGLATWDSLDDTLDCTTLTQCDEELSSNLMYPTPVCKPGAVGSFGSCSDFVSQIMVTEDQRDVIDRFAAIE